MARIPIAQIPNAAPGVGGPTLLNPGVANLSGSSAALNRAAGQMQQSPININAFGAEGAGIASIGDAFAGASGKGADIIADVNARVAKTKENAGLARADVMMRDALAAHMDEMRAVPESEWEERWKTKALPRLDKNLKELGLSPAAVDRLQPHLIRWNGDAIQKIKHEARRKQITEAGQTLQFAAERARADGDFETAEIHVNTLVEDGHWTRAQGDRYLFQMEEELQKQEIHQMVSIAPFDVADDVSEALKSKGESVAFPWLNPEGLRRVQSMAQQEIRRAQMEGLEEMHEAIARGDVKSEAEIEARAGELRLPRRNTQALLNDFNQREDSTPEGQARRFERLIEFEKRISEYDPEMDKDGRQAHQLIFDVSEGLPSSENRAKLFQRIRAKANGGGQTREDEVAGAVLSEVSWLFQNGHLGEWKGLEGDEQSMARLGAARQAREIRDGFQEWARENPSDARDRQKAFAWLERTMKAGNEAARADRENKPGVIRRAWGWASGVFSGSSKDAPASSEIDRESLRQIDDLLRGAGYEFTPIQADELLPSKEAAGNEAPSFLGQKGPASIRFNNPGAQYPGPSARKFGSTGTEVIGGGHKIAVFPDAVSGAAAQFDLLRTSYTGKTVREAITRWSGGHGVDSYLKVIEQEAGLKPDAILTAEMLENPEVAIPLARAMARQEAGKEYPLSPALWLAAHRKALES